MKVRLSVQSPGQAPFEFEHAGPAVALGRNPAGDLVVEQDTPESVVSWEHARIDLSPRQATLTDLASTNGTFRNGETVKGTVPLWPGDSVRLGVTGPVLTVLEIDLSVPTPSPPAPYFKSVPPLAGAPRIASQFEPASLPDPPQVVLRPAKPKAKPKAAPAMSETRGILLEAIRAQRSAHGRQKRALTTVAAVGLLLLLLLGGGLWVFRDQLRAAIDRVRGVEDQMAQINTRVDQVSGDLAGFAKKADDAQEAWRQNGAKLEAIAQNQARLEAAELQRQGKIDKIANNLDQLNQQLAKPEAKPAPAVLPPPDPVRPAPARPPARPVTLEPGQRIDVILKKGVAYTGTLVSITGERVRLQTVPDPQAKPSEFDVRDVQAFQTRDGIFAYDEPSGTFESALTFFKFNKSSASFERMEQGQDTYLSVDASISGPQNAARALLSLGPLGELCLGLALPASKSPQVLPAYHFKEVITAKGVYTYNEQKQDYDYKSHAQTAAEIKAATDQWWKDREEKLYQRRLEQYRLGTDRVAAIAGLYSRLWWWW